MEVSGLARACSLRTFINCYNLNILNILKMSSGLGVVTCDVSVARNTSKRYSVGFADSAARGIVAS